MTHVQVRWGGPAAVFVYAETVLGHARLQPRLHSVDVIYNHPEGRDLYTVFCKRHVKLPRNRSISTLFKGDLLVVSRDIAGTPSDMKLEEETRADDIAKRYDLL